MEVGSKRSLDRIEELEELVKASKETLEGQGESWQGTVQNGRARLRDYRIGLIIQGKNVEIRATGDERDGWIQG